ncbi:hypothetical protein F2Q69_00015160 [Brassica cretica]|uniref:Uncharacterized protein n=1 Tax=Brassica cretica TaxID=69181 RepID=A0A8S9QNH5_BRACR|nr:hypothetical protein F2Q69_00015160 [Brassica cretica]
MALRHVSREGNRCVSLNVRIIQDLNGLYLEFESGLHLTPSDRSTEHLTVSVTIAWLNNGGSEDGDSCLARWWRLERVESRVVSLEAPTVPVR